jgi:hypothetical protein
MKTLIFISMMLLACCINAQILRIKVYETIQYSNYDSVSVMSAISKTVEPLVIKRGNCEYVMDLTKKTGMFITNGVLDTEFDISFVNSGSLFIVNFLFEGFDLGAIINTDIENESFDWYSKYDDDTYEIAKGTNFEIVKSQ